MQYINMKCGYTGDRETVDETETYKEARYMLAEYQVADSSGSYWISQRSCGNWKESVK